MGCGVDIDGVKIAYFTVFSQTNKAKLAKKCISILNFTLERIISGI